MSRYNLSNDIEKKQAEARFKKLMENGKVIELKAIAEARTLKQNAYLHVCISLFAIETGYTLDEAKIILKRGCEFMRYEKKGATFLRHTSLLSTVELTNFIEWIRNLASQDLGLYIPDADEYKNNHHAIDREIESHKKYL